METPFLCERSAKLQMLCSWVVRVELMGVVPLEGWAGLAELEGWIELTMAEGEVVFDHPPTEAEIKEAPDGLDGDPVGPAL